MKKLILDYSLWRCGEEGVNKLGKGNTYLLNSQGFMCCLGQFSKQLDEKITNNLLLNEGEPCSLNIFIPDLVEKYNSIHMNTELTSRAISINDDYKTTPQDKIKKLKCLFKSYNFSIKVINQPE